MYLSWFSIRDGTDPLEMGADFTIIHSFYIGQIVPPADLNATSVSSVHPKMKIQSLSTHPHADWRSGLVF